MPNDVSAEIPALSARHEIHIGYLPAPPLDRLMALRNALVAMKGPLVSELDLQENLRKCLFSKEADDRVMGEPTPSNPG
ncbi:hypothetical protein PspS35_14830 [Pseudomonas sp. S35]|uniref:type VI secretion system contractile sheath small subunit n=1 Tax=Pseudomonas sp. S35 TaxID=1573719 RepID=UPI00132E9073|nr:type VI secretion system contractile sheath small subunit [Pseudomonas sp. S35]QHF44994.1 hypothetical protein PspS35_14830 [Pseudomonas sp. S35]